MTKLEDVVGYVVVDTETGNVWREEIFYSTGGAKNSWQAARRDYDHVKRNWIKPKFNEQTKYRIAKVRLVEVIE